MKKTLANLRFFTGFLPCPPEIFYPVCAVFVREDIGQNLLCRLPFLPLSLEDFLQLGIEIHGPSIIVLCISRFQPDDTLFTVNL